MGKVFDNTGVLNWMQYYAANYQVDLERVKILDITGKNKNLIPTVESHKAVLVFTEAGNEDIFYKMYEAGLGDCTVVYNEGSEPEGPILTSRLSSMINRGINASAAMLIINPNPRSTMKFGMSNEELALGSVKYVDSETRVILLSKMDIHDGKNLCIISGESIVVEAAIMNGEGSIIAVEYSGTDRNALESNIEKFGINNVSIIDKVTDETLRGLPIPNVTMLVASATMEQEIKALLKVNPKMEFVIYSLDFVVAASMEKICEELGLKQPKIIQVQVSRMTSKHTFNTAPAPWIITTSGR